MIAPASQGAGHAVPVDTHPAARATGLANPPRPALRGLAPAPRSVRARTAGFALLLAAMLAAPAHAAGLPVGSEWSERVAASGPFDAGGSAAAWQPSPPPAASALALAAPGLERIGPSANARSISSRDREGPGLPVLSAARAQILLRSLTVPGWGQATLGRNGAAKVFFLVETAIWTTYAAFRIQEGMRRDSYERTARVAAGIDLSGRDEEYRRIVGAFLSSDEYNQLVVYRDAANLHYDDPVRYWEYIEAHKLKGADTWNWADTQDLLRYRAQRKDSQRAEQRAGTAIALAIVNRFASALHASRLAGLPGPEPRSLHLDMGPAGSGEPLDLRCGVSVRF